MRKALGLIQSLYNFIETSTKRHGIFSDIQVAGKPIAMSLKSLSVTRWSCHWDAVKAVDLQLERIVKALLLFTEDTNAKTYIASRPLLGSICDTEFLIGLCVFEIILSNTSSLSKYIQGKIINVLEARRNAS